MKKENYENIRYTLENEYELFLTNDEIDVVLKYGNRERVDSQNKGQSLGRIKTNDREKAFHDEWYKQNKISPGVNSGHGVLQDLFIDRLNKENTIEISQQERMIVATVIQWLGSNCGMSFLHEALKRCGYILVKKD